MSSAAMTPEGDAILLTKESNFSNQFSAPARSPSACRDLQGGPFPNTKQGAILRLMENRSISDVGGTSGGLGQFLVGFAMACIGGFLITHQVSVVGSYWSFWGGSSFGITLLPMLFGVGILFWNGKNIVGWLLTVGGALFIFAGILANMHIYFQPTSLFETMVMLILLVGGLVLIARSLRPHSSKQSQ